MNQPQQVNQNGKKSQLDKISKIGLYILIFLVQLPINYIIVLFTFCGGEGFGCFSKDYKNQSLPYGLIPLIVIILVTLIITIFKIRELFIIDINNVVSNQSSKNHKIHIIWLFLPLIILIILILFFVVLRILPQIF